MNNSILDPLIEERKSDRPIVIQDNKEVFTYRMLFNSAVKLSKALDKCSHNIIIMGENSFNYIVALYAVWFANKTAVIVNENSTNDEIQSIIEVCETDTIINMKQEKLDTISVKYFFSTDIDKSTEDIEFSFELSNDIALICPTSGSTSNPKYVPLSHNALFIQSQAYMEYGGFNDKMVELLVLPITSAAGTIGEVVAMVSCKGQLAIYNGAFNPGKLQRFIFESKCTTIASTPTLVSMLISSSIFDVKKYKYVDTILMFGERISESVISDLESKLEGKTISKFYGLTEASTAFAGGKINKKIASNAIGGIWPHINVRIVDENGTVCDSNQIGEITIKGPTVTSGYLKNNSLNDKIFNDGWMKTGDLGLIDEEGNLYIYGRIKNIIISGGQNIHAEEIEECIIHMEGIEAVKVYGKEHKVEGEIVVADVVIEKGKDITEVDIRKYCSQHLNRYKIPKRINVFDKVELNRGGKITVFDKGVSF